MTSSPDFFILPPKPGKMMTSQPRIRWSFVITFEWIPKLSTPTEGAVPLASSAKSSGDKPIAVLSKGVPVLGGPER